MFIHTSMLISSMIFFYKSVTNNNSMKYALFFMQCEPCSQSSNFTILQTNVSTHFFTKCACSNTQTHTEIMAAVKYESTPIWSESIPIKMYKQTALVSKTLQ